MRSYDFTPLYRAAVGFDRIADVMDRVMATEVAQPTYPPYNIEKLEGDAYQSPWPGSRLTSCRSRSRTVRCTFRPARRPRISPRPFCIAA